MVSSLSAKINLIFGLVMVLVYFAMGTFIFFGELNLLSGINPIIKKLLGVLLVLYAGFRLYRLIKNIREKTYENESEIHT